MTKTSYTPLNLPTDLVEELKIWRVAFSAAYGSNVTYAQMIRGMLDSLEETEPAVVEEMDRMLEKHPELANKLSKE